MGVGVTDLGRRAKPPADDLPGDAEKPLSLRLPVWLLREVHLAAKDQNRLVSEQIRHWLDESVRFCRGNTRRCSHQDCRAARPEKLSLTECLHGDPPPDTWSK